MKREYKYKEGKVVYPCLPPSALGEMNQTKSKHEAIIRKMAAKVYPPKQKIPIMEQAVIDGRNIAFREGATALMDNLDIDEDKLDEIITRLNDKDDRGFTFEVAKRQILDAITIKEK